MTAFDMLNKTINFQLSLIFFFISFFFSAGASDDDLTIEIDNPKFSEKGLDDKIYEIKAERGLKSNNDLQLFKVEGKFKTEDGTWIYLKAKNGNYNQESNLILLNQNIVFYTENEESLISDKAIFYISDDIIEFHENVLHQNKDTFNKILYEGNVKAEFNEYK